MKRLLFLLYLFSFIGAGLCNCIASGLPVFLEQSSNVIGGGVCNYIQGRGNAIVGGGECGGLVLLRGNTIIGDFSGIVSGVGNVICGFASGIFTGGDNAISYNSNFGFVGTGTGNNIGNSTASGYYCPTAFGVIVGGTSNCIDSGTSSVSYSCYNFIGNGATNKICCNTCYASIVAGSLNTSSGNYSLIGTGTGNYIGNSAAGYCNSPYSVIIGGSGNCIDTGTSSVYYSCFNFIGNGQNNKICANTCNSSILGGFNHYTASSYSAILGGANNQIPAGLQYAGVFGNSITAQINNGLHLENLWLKPTSYCNFSGIAPLFTFPQGTIYIDTCLAATGCGTLRVQL